MRRIRNFLKELWADDSAISSVEYALLLAFIAAGIITAAGLLSNAVENELTQTANCIASGEADSSACLDLEPDPAQGN